MGLFDYFRRRRERESVVHDLEVTLEPSPPSRDWAAADARDIADARAAGLDLSQLARMAAMIAQASRERTIQIHEGEVESLDPKTDGSPGQSQ